jgi:hypothetical protein
MSITNIACENWYLDEGHVLLAILPIISFTKASHEKRLQVFHECLDVVFKPLKEASFKGFVLINPHSDEHWFSLCHMLMFVITLRVVSCVV